MIFIWKVEWYISHSYEEIQKIRVQTWGSLDIGPQKLSKCPFNLLCIFSKWKDKDISWDYGEEKSLLEVSREKKNQISNQENGQAKLKWKICFSILIIKGEISGLLYYPPKLTFNPLGLVRQDVGIWGLNLDLL